MSFLSKDDALASLEKEMPHIQEQFSKYAIKNPLPSTIYIRFQDQQQFERLQTNITQYEDLFQNFDISSIAGFQQQDTRAKQVINMANVGRWVSMGIAVGVVAIIVLFLLYGVMILFLEFQKQIDLDLLLGASYTNIISPFLLYTC
jgi:cell division protein FtsX